MEPLSSHDTDLPDRRKPLLQFTAATWEVTRSLARTTGEFIQAGIKNGAQLWLTLHLVFPPIILGLAAWDGKLKPVEFSQLTQAAPDILSSAATGFGYLTLGFAAAAAVFSIPAGLMRLKKIGPGKFIKIDGHRYTRTLVNKAVEKSLIARDNFDLQLAIKVFDKAEWEDRTYFLAAVPDVVSSLLRKELNNADNDDRLPIFTNVIHASRDFPFLTNNVTPDMVRDYFHHRMNSKPSPDRDMQTLEMVGSLLGDGGNGGKLLGLVPPDIYTDLANRMYTHIQQENAGDLWTIDRLRKIRTVFDSGINAGFDALNGIRPARRYLENQIYNMQNRLLGEEFTALSEKIGEGKVLSEDNKREWAHRFAQVITPRL